MEHPQETTIFKLNLQIPSILSFLFPLSRSVKVLHRFEVLLAITSQTQRPSCVLNSDVLSRTPRKCRCMHIYSGLPSGEGSVPILETCCFFATAERDFECRTRTLSIYVSGAAEKRVDSRSKLYSVVFVRRCHRKSYLSKQGKSRRSSGESQCRLGRFNWFFEAFRRRLLDFCTSAFAEKKPDLFIE